MEVELVVLNLVECLHRLVSSVSGENWKRRTDRKDLMIPFERESILRLTNVRITLLLQQPETLHVHQIVQRTRRFLLLTFCRIRICSRVVSQTANLGEESNNRFGFMHSIGTDQILGVLRIQESILSIQCSRFAHGLHRSDRISTALQDPRLEHAEFGKGRGVCFGESENVKSGGL